MIKPGFLRMLIERWRHRRCESCGSKRIHEASVYGTVAFRCLDCWFTDYPFVEGVSGHGFY